MLDLIIIRYKLTINVSVTYQEYIQNPADNTKYISLIISYNKKLVLIP